MSIRIRLAALGATGASALAIAVVMGGYFEGTGPTTTAPDGSRRYVPYIDPVGVLTVCRGVTGAGVVRNKLYSDAECHTLETDRYEKAEAGAKRQISTWKSLNRWQQAALIDFTYNLGEGNLSTSTMRKLFNARQYDAACAELAKWVKGRQNGQLVVLPGLKARREVNQDLCLNWKD